MGKYTEAQKKSAEKYLSNFDKLTIRTPKGKRELYKAYAEKNKTSINKLVIDYLDSLIE